jgi:hypothetical protein
MRFQEIISREDQYAVAKARAEISWLGAMLTRHADTIVDIVIDRLNRMEVKRD